LLCLSVVVADLVLLGVLAYYTSWLLVLAFIFISGIIGSRLLKDGLRRYAIKSEQAMNANEMSVENFLLGASARVAAGVLFVVPGVLTDLIALLLLSPAGKWLSRNFFMSLFMGAFPHFSNQEFNSHTPGEKSAKDEVIDVKVKNADCKKPQ